MGSRTEEEVQGLLPVASHHNLVGDVALPQRADRQVFVVLVVLNEEDHLAGIHETPPVRDGPSGSVNWNVAPSFSLPSAHTRPPCRRTIRPTVARPTPLPSNCSMECSR